MSIPKDFDGLYFSCECVSARKENYSDPWAGIAKNKLLVDGTKEKILNLVAQEPQTISQLAKKLKLAVPSIYTHVYEMLASELLRDSEEWEKLHPKERYYEPNFPVVRAEDRAEFEKICQEMSEQVAGIFEKARPQLEKAFNKTTLGEREWEFADLTQYLYACVQRGARRILEERGTLQPAEKHRNGIDWGFWAEEPSADGK
ncbi:MAG: ArsR family transcriptional regulator [Acidobacteria bacterium]|jgi:DNA-binding transcriptional ArsR family regulator|nr:ArsR family transcriptional regulator [Acidobacteriota bacterium]